MSASVHTPGPTRRGPEYCVDCYAVNGRVTVATRMFKDDALCERHYLALCKELEIEPDVTTLSEAKAAKEIAQPTPIKKIRQTLTRRPEAGLKPAGHPVRESVAVRALSDVSRPESTEAHGGNQSAVVTTFPSDSDLAEAARSLPSDPAAPARLQDRSAGDSVDPRGIADAAIHKTRPSRSVSSGSPAGVLTRAVGMPNRGSRQNGITSEHRNQARQGGETSTKVSDHPISASLPDPQIFADVTAALGAQGYLLRDAQRAVEQSFKPGDTFEQAFKKAFVIVFQARSAVRRAVTSSSQRPDDSVAPAAEGLRDRAHSPTRPAPSSGSGVPQTPSAANPQPSNARKEITMPRSGTALRNDDGKRVCSCGCGTVLGSRHPYIKGHNTNPAAGAAPAKRGRPRKPAQQSNGAPHTPGDHEGDGRRDVARHVSLSTSPFPVSPSSTNLPPVAITTNGNGHAPHTAACNAGKIASDGAYLVPCQVSEWAMDRIWLKLTPEEKAELLFRPPEAPQKEQQEPAHHA